MPSHRLPRGPEFRARRAGARDRRRGEWRRQLPLFLVFMTGLQVAGWPSADVGAGRQILDAIGSGIGGVLFTVVFVLALLPVHLRADTLRQTQALPRPRGQYLALAAGWIAAAGGLTGASLLLGRSQTGPGWLARGCGGFAVWFAVFGLAMLGRAACWGRVRNLFWWYRPLWIPGTAAAWLTPPPPPAPRRDPRSEPDHPG